MDSALPYLIVLALVALGGFTTLAVIVQGHRTTLERITTRALASEKVWEPSKELHKEPAISTRPISELEAFEEEQEELRKIEAHLTQGVKL